MDLWIREHLNQTNPNKASHFYGPTKSYISVPLDDQQRFWIYYCDTIRKGKNPFLFECIGNRDDVQLGFDLTLKFERLQVPSKENVVTDLIESIDNYIHHIIGVIQTTMKHYFVQSQQNSEFIAAYMRREDDSLLVWKPNTVVYAGRIIFPYARIRKEYLTNFHHFILNQLQLNGGSPDKFLTISPLNGLDTLIKTVSDNINEMYGSSADEDVPPFKLHKMYGFLNTDVINSLELDTVFTPTLHSSVSQGILPPHILTSKILDYWLPLFFSAGFYNTPLKAQDGLSLSKTEAPRITLSVIKEGGESVTNLERARLLSTLLSRRRVEEYWSWYDIGQALHSIDSGKDGLKLWQWVTGQSDFKVDDDCENIWYTFNDDSEVDIETLEYFASKDNKEKHDNYRENDIKEAINIAIKIQEHTPIAKAFKACFPYDFVCSNYQSGSWYYYDKYRWSHIDGESILMWYINEKFQPKLEQMRADIAVKIANSKDKEFKDRNETRIQMIGELIKKLSRNNFKQGLCKELKIYYHNPKFEHHINMNSYYTATPSGIIDLRGGVGTVRPGKPQDYITKTTRYPYPSTYTWETPNVKKVLEYIAQVFRNISLRKYFWRLVSSLLLSGNNDKIFPIFSGGGDNSKSILVRLIESALGNYAVKLPTSLITEKRTAADSATPTLIHSRGAKVAFLQEPNPKDSIQSGTVKELTGNDSIYVRDLFQKGAKIVEMEITVVPILIANKIPVIPDCQKAIWNRTRVLDFLSIWTSDAPDDEMEQFKQGIFKIDTFFDRKISSMAPAFLWIMVQKYAEYYEHGLNDPKEVLQATENFRVANNYYIHFTRDSVRQVINEEGVVDLSASVTLDELFNVFKSWYKDQQFGNKIPNKTEFKENIEGIWKEKADYDKKWYGIQLISQANTLGSLLSF